VPGKGFEGVALGGDVNFLPTADGRRVIRGRAFDDNRDVAVMGIYGT
jgi:hypothetical protein